MANTRATIGDQATLDGLVSNTLETLEEDGLTAVPNSCLRYNTGIKKVILPSATSIGSYGFANCTNLEEVDLGTSVSSINSNCFNGATKLESLILRNTSAMVSLSNINAFTGTAIQALNGIVYVPNTQLSNYKANANWSNFYVLPLSDYPTDPATLDYLPGETISDDWSTIITTVDAGNAVTTYGVGATKTLSVSGVGKVLMQLIAVDTDELSDNTGNAKTTWLAKNIMFKRQMNSANTNVNGWAASEMRTYLSGDFFNALPSVLQSNIKQVKKTYHDHTTSSTLLVDDKVWIPSCREMFGGSSYESSGCDYTSIFSSNSARMKYYNGVAAEYWTRTTYSSGNSFRNINIIGGLSSAGADISYGAVVGFCL